MIQRIFAYAALAYLITIIIYVIVTRAYGTPYKNSITPKQLELKKKSMKKRGIVFGCALAATIILLIIWKPFK